MVAAAKDLPRKSENRTGRVGYAASTAAAATAAGSRAGSPSLAQTIDVERDRIAHFTLAFFDRVAHGDAAGKIGRPRTEVVLAAPGACTARGLLSSHELPTVVFGVNGWTGRNADDRIINEHDKSDDSAEELYFVSQGRAVFELDGERRDAPAGTFVFVAPDVKRTASPRSLDHDRRRRRRPRKGVPAGGVGDLGPAQASVRVG